MKILKASAGSGKTYRLSEEVVDLLLKSSDPLAYREFLAVTFTNKATDEMKERILLKLAKRAKSDPKAKTILIDILHDYSAFSVSTIDRFFQKALKSFARELSQSANYQIELDKKMLIQESMDRILDSLSEDSKVLLGWLRKCLEKAVEEGERPQLDSSLYEIGNRLKDLDHASMAEKHHIDDSKAYSLERLEKLHSECVAIKNEFQAEVLDAARQIQDKIVGANAKKQIVPYTVPLKKWETVKEPKASLVKELDGTRLGELLLSSRFKEYGTAVLIDDMVFTLGIAGEFYKQFDALLKEKNIMCLDESNSLLKKIIDGSDAPFVYEKMGVRYRNFLLDEFQDTSRIQWDNFQPLLKESESSSGKNLIVGDIKQSIYRWRYSDWKLLGEDVETAFPAADSETLQSNWRSCSAIVKFNNEFFEFAARKLGQSAIYSDVAQEVKVMKENQKGFVRATFCEDQCAATLESVQNALDHGAQYGDIAIIASTHAQGAKIAQTLIQAGIPVISDDSLRVKSSLTVGRLTFALKSHEYPSDSISKFLTDGLQLSFPENFHSLIDLCEELLRQLRKLDSDLFDAETLYIQSFMDTLRSWTEIYGNNLQQFLKYWNENDPYIGSPDNACAVRIITIHKSKGLQFRYVIFPFAESITLSGKRTKWCYLSTDGTSLPEVFRGIYPINLNAGIANTLFSKDLETERELEVIDALNLFYVAFTRAEKSLHIIADIPGKGFLQAIDKLDGDMSARDLEYKFTNMSQLLYLVGNKSFDFNLGEPYDFTVKVEKDKDEDEEEPPTEFGATYRSIPLAGRLSPSEDSQDFFGEDGVTGAAASQRVAGIILHAILSSVNTPGDLKDAVDTSRNNGLLSDQEADEAFELLEKRVAARSEWFSGKGRNEVSIIGTDGREHRPDRVIVDGGKVTVIDYKFGEPSEKHLWQVRGYKKLYRQLGYSDVRGYIWYVRPDEVKEVI